MDIKVAITRNTKRKGRYKKVATYMGRLIKIIEQNPWIYAYLEYEGRCERDIAKAAFSNDGRWLSEAPDCITDDKELVCLALKNGGNFEDISERLQHDKEVIMCAIEHEVICLDEIDEDYLEDLEILYKAVACNPYDFTYFVEELQEDRDVAYNCVKINSRVYEYLNDELKSDWEILEEAVRNGVPIDWLEKDEVRVKGYEDVVSDPELVLCAIKHNGGNQLRFACEEIRYDKEIAEFAIKQGLTMISCLSEKMKSSKAVVRRVFKNILQSYHVQYATRCIHELPSKVIMNEDFMLELIKDNPFVFKEISHYGKYDNLDFFVKAYKINPQTIKYMASYMKKEVKDAIKGEV